MALRLKPETREAWRLRVELAQLQEKRKAWDDFVKQQEAVWGTPAPFLGASQWRPVPRAEPAPEKVYDTHTFDIYSKTWVDT